MTLIYEVKDLKKYYGQDLVLDIPSLIIEKGSALILEGANGSGKSTLLRLLAFLEEPSSGSLLYLPSPQPRMECTLLLQEPWLLRETVYRNVTLGLKLRGIRSELNERFCAAMKSVGFDDPERFRNRRPYALSGGEKQRVALAARLILEPVVLLLDEPTAHVDSASGKHIVKALLEIHERGTCVICSTHDPDLAHKLGAKVMTMVKP